MTCGGQLATDEGRADLLLEVGLVIVATARADQSDR
jgi:hypothetical protein